MTCKYYQYVCIFIFINQTIVDVLINLKYNVGIELYYLCIYIIFRLGGITTNGNNIQPTNKSKWVSPLRSVLAKK